ncbi:MAG TPA: Zn-dependent hydrolase [Chloroflexi bacterium]|nr:Zn-dependent hydrolase [Chloroflexota bacterium]
MNPLLQHIHWLGHDSFRLESGDLQIYIDPYQLTGGPAADLILITHEHRDHCSPEDVAKIQTDATIIVTIAAAASQLRGEIQIVRPGDKLTVKGLPIEAVPAYNLTKFRAPGQPFHPKEAGHVGFIITIEGQRLYHTGDVDVIPEMATFEVDIALLPVSGTYVMTAEEAVEAAKILHPKVAIPMHVGRGIGGLEMAEQFRQNAPVTVKILEIEA